MSRSDTEIHIDDLLLTLDYLLHHTDENHPASRTDICRHAREYGLTYNGGKQGDDVKRQRITTTLNILRELTNEYGDKFPFVLEQTSGNKYYIEQRNGLNEAQIAKVLAAMKNDKYTGDEDVSFLQERLLEAFSTTDEHREVIKKEYRRLIRGVKKFDPETMRKIRLIEKAHRENRLIKVRMIIYKDKTPEEFFFWYRVYIIKEVQGKPHAFLIPVYMPVHKGVLQLKENYIFKPIEKIDIPNLPDSKVLNYDKDENKDFEDLDKLFKKSNPKLYAKFGSFDNFALKMISPKGGEAIIASFYFHRNLLKLIKQSYEEFFVETLSYQESNLVGQMKSTLEQSSKGLRNATIVAEELKENEQGKYCLVNVTVNLNAFRSWLLSDPYGDGSRAIGDLVTVIKPDSLKQSLASYYAEHFKRYSDALTNEQVEDVLFS